VVSSVFLQRFIELNTERAVGRTNRCKSSSAAQGWRNYNILIGFFQEDEFIEIDFYFFEVCGDIQRKCIWFCADKLRRFGVFGSTAWRSLSCTGKKKQNTKKNY